MTGARAQGTQDAARGRGGGGQGGRPGPGWIDRLPRDRLIAEVSVWSADLGRLAEDVARVDAHADLWHVDVCDGHFAPQLLIFPDLAAVLRRLTAKPLHVHLMVDGAILEAQIAQFAAAGADLISIHAEHGPDAVDRALDRIAGLGLAAGLVLTLDTPVADAAPWLDRADVLTLVGTRIGIKGVSPDETTYARLASARGLIDARGGDRRIVLAADGGIRESTVPRMRAAGAQTVVLGSLAFGADDLPARMRWLAGL
ncbi:MAG: ribulose-phosphate 3-epimerase [Rhodobacteraceae bacterium]|nr:ribulose-phosphate 3-epimerase [Paracoccaceae bacterium]